ncbi:MAG: redoxin domain-containing protein [Lysobacteraceae bacterium]
MSDTSMKLAAGSTFPQMSWPTVAHTDYAPAARDGWRAVVVYRGKHCPLCRKYLVELQQLQARAHELGVDVVAVSADPRDRAAAQVAESGLTFPVACELSVEQMKRLGLYVSAPRSPEETDRPFAEPGLFVINPQGNLQIIDVSNAPFARPALAQVFDGIELIQTKDYPIRGTA